MYKYEVNELQIKIIENYLISQIAIAIKTLKNYSKKH